ncbi:hypothetical protein M5D96_013777 [Drosophila gunungcola]|uniref:Uncharacterized protein n=1 Tax=Drosophila gunungcola TaxID=103775 RepID=A0A9P9YAQ5_9MUSC|nr:hypothetical protein M5D96_013777 [Drosophila gunungcola]
MILFNVALYYIITVLPKKLLIHHRPIKKKKRYTRVPRLLDALYNYSDRLLSCFSEQITFQLLFLP